MNGRSGRACWLAVALACGNANLACDDATDPAGTATGEHAGGASASSTTSVASGGAGAGGQSASGGAATGGSATGGSGPACGAIDVAGDDQHVVRIVYLRPPDKPMRADYIASLEAAIRDVQVFYQTRTDGAETFRLHEPIVEVYDTPHESAYYASHDSGNGELLWFWDNALGDGFALTGGAFYDPLNIWVFFIDAEQTCGQAAEGGTSGVAIHPALSLKGLVGENPPDACGTQGMDYGRCRWVGAVAHNLGHALGMVHPPECEDADPRTACEDGALMYGGYVTYPEAKLLAADQAVLAASPFLEPRAVPDACDCKTF